MILFARLPGAKPDPIEVALWLWHHFAAVIGSNAERIIDVGFGQASPGAQGGRLIAKQREKRRVRSQRSIEIGFALHGVLSDPVEMPAYTRHL